MVLLRVGRGGFADPGAVGMRLAATLHPLHVAGTLALDDGLELGPVELAERSAAAISSATASKRFSAWTTVSSKISSFEEMW